MDQLFISVSLPEKDLDNLREFVDRACIRLGCGWRPWPDEPLDGSCVLLFVDSDEEGDGVLKERAKEEAAARGIPFVKSLPSVVMRPKWLAETLIPSITREAFDFEMLKQSGTTAPQEKNLAEPAPTGSQEDNMVSSFQAASVPVEKKAGGNVFSKYFWGILKNKYARFSGRADISEYWYYVLFNMLVAFFVGLVDGLIGADFILVSIYLLAVMIPGIAVGVRRLHDTGRRGWLILLSFVPFIGTICAIYLLVMFLLPGDYGDNEYGPDPRMEL